LEDSLGLIEKGKQIIGEDNPLYPVLLSNYASYMIKYSEVNQPNRVKELKTGEKILEQVVNEFKNAEDGKGVAIAENNKAVVFLGMNKYSDALSHSKTAVALLEPIVRNASSIIW